VKPIVVAANVMAVLHSKRLYFILQNSIAAHLALCLVLTSCTVGPNVPKGEAIVQGRGSEALTNEGDPLVKIGTDARKVPIEFAKVYTKRRFRSGARQTCVENEEVALLKSA
jgi:hypothetical protein